MSRFWGKADILSHIPIRKRRQLFASLVTPKIMALGEVGDIEKVRERVEKCMSSWQE